MQDRTSAEYQQWRQNVRQRDRNSCRRCGFDTNLEVHHIKPLVKYPDFATELDNGLTLCGNCHSLLRGREETVDLLNFIEESPYSRDKQIVERLMAMMSEQLKALNDKFAELTGRKAEVPIGNDSFTEPGHIQAEMLRLEAEEKLREAERLRREADAAVKKRQREAEEKRQREAEQKRQREVAKQQRKAEEKHIATKQPVVNFPIAPVSGHTDAVTSIAYSPNGNTIATSSYDRTVKLWSIQNREVVATFFGHNDIVYSVVYSPKGDMIATGSRDGTVKLWLTHNQRLIATFEVEEKAVSSVAFSPNGDMIATGVCELTPIV